MTLLRLSFALLLLSLPAVAAAEMTWTEFDPPVRHRRRDITVPDVLQAARAELNDCLDDSTLRLVVSARVSPRYGLRIRARSTPRDASVEDCADLVVRRRVVPVTSSAPSRFSHGQVEIRAPRP